MISPYYKESDATLEVDLADVDLGDVEMVDAIRQLRHIARLHRNKRNCLRELATWLKARNKVVDPEPEAVDTSEMDKEGAKAAERAAIARQAEREAARALRKVALEAADADRIKSEGAERVAIATQAEREAAEAAAKAANDKARAAAAALEEKKAEERLRARVGRPREE